METTKLYGGAEDLTPAQLDLAVRGHNTQGRYGEDRCECSGCALKRDRENAQAVLEIQRQDAEHRDYLEATPDAYEHTHGPGAL